MGTETSNGHLSTAQLEKLRCPETGLPLEQDGLWLRTPDGRRQYRLSETGIPQLTTSTLTWEASVQQAHYDRIADIYIENFGYPHTQEYMAYLDEALLSEIKGPGLGEMVEICCGRGEAFILLNEQIMSGIGVDISMAMLNAAREAMPDSKYLFVQADATKLPIQDKTLDSVVMLGGIHHINDRQALFAHIFRILKPGGRFYWREPVSDFFLWQWLRAIIYRLSPTLDADTEQPLHYRETVQHLKTAGFELDTWKTHGFIGFCLLMNSDVLVFNRLFRYIPGIRKITRLFAQLDSLVLRLPGMRRRGLQVVGVARKP